MKHWDIGGTTNLVPKADPSNKELWYCWQGNKATEIATERQWKYIQSSMHTGIMM